MNTLIDGAMGALALILVMFLSGFYYEFRKQGRRKMRIQNIRRLRKLITSRTNYGNDGIILFDEHLSEKQNLLSRERQAAYTFGSNTPAL